MSGTLAAANTKPFAAGAAQARRQRGAAACPTARLGGSGGGYGGGYGGSSNDPRNRGLILPGQDSSAARGGRLVLPGQGGAAPGGGGLGGGGLAGVGGTPAVQQNFRPPPGFMNAVAPSEVAPEVEGMPTDEMLNRLRSTTGQWHQLAKLLPALLRAGMDGVAVEEETGLERKVQNVWHTAVQVRGWWGAGCG